MPPAMDNSLNTNALKMVSFAPMFLLMNSFWMIDNKAIFNNYWEYKMKVNDQMKSGHFFQGFMVNHATPIFLFTMFSLIIKTFLIIVPESLLKSMGFTMEY